MDAAVYEVLALGMRYVFTFIGVMIVLRTFAWLRKDRRLKHQRLRQLPDAGTVGVLTVITGDRQLRAGAVIPVPHEGVIGALRTCDMTVPVPEVADVHADFTFADGKGLYVLPRRGCSVVVDGQLIRTTAEGKRCPMQHGSILEIGQAVLQLGVFAGLKVRETQIEPWFDAGFRNLTNASPSAYQPEQPWPGYPEFPSRSAYSAQEEQPWPGYQPPSQGVPPLPQQPGPYPPYPPDPRMNAPYGWQGGDPDEP